jgi:broad specificity phosphatase PhoE
MEHQNIYSITLLRHGESVGNAGGYHQGQADFPLSQKGQEQATRLANYWSGQDVHYDLIITSPLSRARQTAGLLAEALHTPIETKPVWMERDAGLLSGLHTTEAAELYPRPAFMPPYQPIGNSGESMWALYLRAGAAVQDLVGRQPGSYLVVSHGGILNMVLYAILGIAPQANNSGPRFRFSNTGYARLTYNPAEHVWRVLSIDERPHLEPGDEEAAAFGEIQQSLGKPAPDQETGTEMEDG